MINGNIIGAVNTTNEVTASGIWNIRNQYYLLKDSKWPKFTQFGTVALNNNTGSTITSCVVPLSMTLTSSLGAAGENLRFFYNGQLLSHWVAKVVSTTAYVYIKVPNLAPGAQSILVSAGSSNISSTTGLFSAFTNFPNSVGTGFSTYRNGGTAAITYSTGNARISTDTAISFVNTSSSVGTNIRVDSDISPESNAILEVLVRADTNNLSNGIKFRWDYRSANLGVDWLSTPLHNWTNLGTQTNVGMGAVNQQDIYSVAALGNNFYAYRNFVQNSKTYTSSASQYNQSGIVGIASHVGAINAKWIAAYDNYDISSISYTSIIP